MGARLPSMLKDAGLTAFVAAALGIFVVGFRTVDVGRGLTFDYHLVDLAVAVVTIFFGRLGLSLAADGLRWPAKGDIKDAVYDIYVWKDGKSSPIKK